MGARRVTFKHARRRGPILSASGIVWWHGICRKLSMGDQAFQMRDEAQIVTAVTMSYMVYHDNKIERLKLFLNYWYSVSRGQRAIRINNKWNFINTRMIVRRNNNIDKGSDAGLFPPSIVKGAVSRNKLRPDSRPTERR
jgi:hypothetical protein